MRIDEELKAFLGAQSFAIVSTSLDLGSGEEGLLLVKATRDGILGLRGAGGAVEVGWVPGRTTAGPTVCLVLRVRGHEVGELTGEVYFDPTDEADRKVLERLGQQARLQVAFFDEELDLAWLAQVPWDEVRRLEAEQVLDRAEGDLAKLAAYDFEQAKDLFQEEVSHDQLLARAFPD